MRSSEPKGEAKSLHRALSTNRETRNTEQLRLLRFPTEYSLGSIRIPGLTKPAGPLPDAQGTVEVPHGMRVILTIHSKVDLSPLAELRPDDVSALDLHHPAVDDADLQHIAGWTGLEELDAKWASITDQGLGHLEGLVSLKKMVLGGGGITDDGLQHLRGLRNLEGLYLNETEVTDSGLAHLTTLSRLKVLSLSGTRVTGKGLTNVPSVQWLDLSKSAVTEIGLESLERLTDLTTLVLSNTNISDNAMSSLRNLRSLKSLDLSGTSASTSSLAQNLPQNPSLHVDLDYGLPEEIVDELRALRPDLIVNGIRRTPV